MLKGAVERYIGLRHATGFKFDKPARLLRNFAEFAAAKGDTHVKTATAIEWAASGCTPGQRGIRLRAVARFAKHLQAEEPAHEIPPAGVFVVPSNRPTPYIYTPDEIARIIEAASQLRRCVITPLRAELYQTLFGLIAATGLRIGEALRLCFDDLLPGGVLRIRKTKCIAIAWTRRANPHRRGVAPFSFCIGIAARRGLRKAIGNALPDHTTPNASGACASARRHIFFPFFRCHHVCL